MTAVTSFLPRPAFLSQVLLFDAATCVAMGLALLFAAGPLSALLQLPLPLLRYAGLLLLPVAAFMAWVGSRRPVPRAGTWLVVAGNWAWVVASIALLMSDRVSPNAFGVAFVLLQAVVVVVLAGLETAGLRHR